MPFIKKPITLNRNHQPGLFIAFEGGEGSGKSTLIKKLKDELVKKGVNVALYREPGGSAFAEQVRELFLTNDNLSPETSLHLMNAQRQHNLETIVIPALNNGFVVLADRFSGSTMVYQGILEGKFPYVFKTMVDYPAINVLIDTPPEIAIDRIRQNNRDTNRFDNVDMVTHHDIYNAYKQLDDMFDVSNTSKKSKIFGYWDFIIDGSETPEKLSKTITEMANMIAVYINERQSRG